MICKNYPCNAKFKCLAMLVSKLGEKLRQPLHRKYKSAPFYSAIIDQLLKKKKTDEFWTFAIVITKLRILSH